MELSLSLQLPGRDHASSKIAGPGVPGLRRPFPGGIHQTASYSQLAGYSLLGREEVMRAITARCGLEARRKCAHLLSARRETRGHSPFPPAPEQQVAFIPFPPLSPLLTTSHPIFVISACLSTKDDRQQTRTSCIIQTRRY